MSEDDELLTVEYVADTLKVTEWTVREWCKAGKIKATKPGRAWRIRRADLVSFLRERHGE